MDLNIHSNDKSYLTEYEKERLELIAINRDLYNGEPFVFLDTYRNMLKSIGADNISEQIDQLRNRYVAKNVVRPIAEGLSDLLYSCPIKITDQDNQEELDEIVSQLDLTTELHTGDIDGSLAGDSVFTVWKDGDTPYITVVPPENWTPIPYPQDNSKVMAHLVSSYYDTDDVVNNKTRSILAVKRYEAYKTYYEAYLVESNKSIIKRIMWDEKVAGSLPSNIKKVLDEEGNDVRYVEEHNVPYPLCFRVSNRKLSNSLYGKPTFTKTTYTNIREINEKLSQIKTILNKNSNPILQVPKSMIQYGTDEQGNTIEVANVDKGVIATDSEDNLKYITYEASLEENRKQIENCLANIYLETSTNAVMFGANQESLGYMSGVSIELLFQRPLSFVKTKKQPYIKVIKDIVNSFRYMENKQPFQLNVQFEDGLTQDSKTVAETILLKNGSQPTSSLRTSVREAHPDATEGWISEEVDRIKLENRVVGFE